MVWENKGTQLFFKGAVRARPSLCLSSAGGPAAGACIQGPAALLYCFVILRHERRQVVHGVTVHPTAAWVSQEIREAFPFDTAPRYVLRDRDGIYGEEFRCTMASMGIEEVVTAPRSPWQNPFVERLIDTIRRECLDHIFVLNEAHLKRILTSFFAYYHTARTHSSLERNAPVPRAVEPPEGGKVVAVPMAGGLHHRYRRVA